MMMRVSILGAVIVAFVALAVYRAEPRAKTPQAPGGKGPVVVELFTSEGCSSCPPADALLRRLEANPSVDGAEVIVLGWHVDYWDHQGWKDRFSSAEFTQRQQNYAEAFATNQVYTPQMVVDGRAEFVGSDETKARGAILEAANAPKTAATLMTRNVGPTTIEVQAEVKGRPGAAREVRTWLVITEKNLQSEVRAGENQGVLMKHAGVVRLVKRLGLIPLSKDTRQTAVITIEKGWKPHDMRAVVILQDDRSLGIVGAASIPLR
jgi:hypothetical protein